MRTIVTGAGGFIGSELVTELRKNKHVVEVINRINIQGLFSGCDLTSRNVIPNLAMGIRELNPDVIFHLASDTSIKKSWINPYEFIKSNIFITENLVEAIALSGLDPMLILMSSSAVYDDKSSPIEESFRLAPSSPYAISKLAGEAVALRYRNSVVVRPFFTIGAKRKGDIIHEWLPQIKKIKSLGVPAYLNVGDLSLERDYLDVSESAKSLIQISENATPGEIYNLCSNTSTRLQDVCDALISEMQCDSLVKFNIKPDLNQYARQRVIGDNSKLNQFGINPIFNLKSSISIIAATHISKITDSSGL
jgi:GDP-4-dehydro-6-deoxy-D-mannose reductase